MHRRLQPRMLLFFFSLLASSFACLLIRCSLTPIASKMGTRKKGFPRGQIDIDDIDYRRLVETIQSSFSTCLRWQSFVPWNIFVPYSCASRMCIAFHVFFKRRDILQAVRATWIENMSQFNEFPRAGETYRYIRARDWVWTGRSSWISTNKSLHWWNGVLCRASTG